ncbi:MAG: ferredoxin [Methanosaeta sp. PtaB.Bin018]|jgi:MinD superfamily P-loop ATPase|nr:P-loop NTPase [Methanothrix sp.]OPX75417.1 MAG: ferredoxin [Methanosaeta sp. PtaB.Bin018]OPY45336.1 MAG: ferredoxin [Methanosaeta sp. PtaU1.Bin016]
MNRCPNLSGSKSLKISIASGKGGTGKTLVATSLAVSLADRGAVIADCDVEEPNVHLFFPNKQPLGKKECEVPVPIVDERICTHCGLCSDNCAFHAMAVLPQKVLVFQELCHGCGACALVCPMNAISEGRRSVGEVFRAESGCLEIVWGDLKPGEARTVPLIRSVKDEAKGDVVIVDCPPGTSCSMVESVRGTDFCLLVTESTPFGLYDLNLALRTLEMMKIPQGVLVNKSGIGDRKVYEYLEKQKVSLLMEIPFSRTIAELYSRGIIFVEHMPEWKERFAALAEKIEEQIA